MFSPQSKIFLWIKPKKRKKLFCGKFGSIPTSRSTRKGKKCFLWWAYVYLNTRCYTTSHLHQVFFCDFVWIFSLFSLVGRISNFWSLRNLIKQLFHSRLLDMRLLISYPTRAHGIIVNYEVVGSVRFLSCVCFIVAAILELIANTTECTPASGFWSIWTCSGRVTS